MITNLTIFTSAICNLNCSYCYVKKSNELFEYDKQVINSILSNEYIYRFIKDFPESIDTLETLEFWGAEPTIHLDLIASKLIDYKKAFKNLHKISFSSNYTLPNFIEQIKFLTQEMGRFKDTNWELYVQCSIDGSKEITDRNRGIGTTDKIINNINLLKTLDIPDNVSLLVANKSTLSNEQFGYLQDIANVENYVNFLRDILEYQTKNKKFWVTAPTCVEPYYYTKNDGILFSKVVDNFITISKKMNMTCVPYVRNRKIKLSEYIQGGFCGQCNQCVTMLPNNLYATCHRCGFDIVSEHYKMRQKEYNLMFNRSLEDNSNWIVDINDYKKLQNNMKVYYDTCSKNIFSQVYNTSKVLLNTGEISNQYYNDTLLKQHILLFTNFTKCLQTNKELTGSPFCVSSLFIPLFFNGALTKIYNFIEEKNLI